MSLSTLLRLGCLHSKSLFCVRVSGPPWRTDGPNSENRNTNWRKKSTSQIRIVFFFHFPSCFLFQNFGPPPAEKSFSFLYLVPFQILDRLRRKKIFIPDWTHVRYFRPPPAKKIFSILKGTTISKIWNAHDAPTNSLRAEVNSAISYSRGVFFAWTLWLYAGCEKIRLRTQEGS